MVRLFPSHQTAVVCGITGQDGAYLAAHLLRLGYTIVGTSRNAVTCDRRGLERLGIAGQVVIESLHPADLTGTLDLLARVRPDEIYNLSGQSSIAVSHAEPEETFRSIALATVNLLEAVRVSGIPTRVFVAGSTAMYGDNGGRPVDESTAPAPTNPYALAKAAAFAQVAHYRSDYGVHACTGILANHESPLRPERFVTQKIAAAVCRIAAGDPGKLVLGDLTVERDWGWASEYVIAMHGMLQADQPEDLVIATGVSAPLETFVAEAFSRLGLDWRRHVVHDERLVRRGEARCLRTDPGRAAERIGWRAKSTICDVARMMVDARSAEAGQTLKRAA